MPIFMLLIIKESPETILELLGFGFRGCRGASVGIQMASLLCVLPSGVGAGLCWAEKRQRNFVQFSGALTVTV